ncbi:MAG: amino acid permease [Planctomycetota bacterium]
MLPSVVNNLSDSHDSARPTNLFGTMGGVFTPCTLTILGVIMFLRLDYVVGQSGIFWALAIVLVSKLITLLTTISLSGIATNTRVKGGGAYFLISRSLGVEFGGGIGVVFFLAQAISVALYCLGFAEAVRGSFPDFGIEINAIATATNLLVFAAVMIGASWAITLQYGILAILVLSLLSFFAGVPSHFEWETLQENFSPGYTDGQNVYLMFALFFPAVTGIMAGANMSGDLKDPARSIPLGTLLAIFVTGVIYLTLVVLLGGTQSRDALTSNQMVMSEVAVVPFLIVLGVMAATLSSALGSMMGAPRILQALAKDMVFRRLAFFGAGSGPNNEPRRAIILTFVISQVAILMGDINAIAPIITMAFLITYGMLNLATFYERISRNPSYRPRFRIGHWSLSLLGAISCLAVMFLIGASAALISIVVMWLLHQYLSNKQVEARWGDLQSGIAFERARSNLLKLEDHLYHPKNWRPIILAFSGMTWTQPQLAIYGHWFTTGHGILSLGQVIIGDVDNLLERRNSQERILHKFIKDETLKAFPAVVVSNSQSEGIESLVQCHGLGALRPNTVLLNWPDAQADAAWFGCTLRTVANLNRSIIAMKMMDKNADMWAAPKGPIDIWWRGEKNGSLMLLLAYLLTNNPAWRGRPIRLLRMIPSEAGINEVTNHLQSLISQSRITAEPAVFVGNNISQTIQRESKNASITIIGFDTPAENEETDFYDRMEVLTSSLDRVVFVNSHGDAALDS